MRYTRGEGMEQLQFLTDEPKTPPQGASAAPAGAVGFVYRMPGKALAGIVAAALADHVTRRGQPPAMIRVSKGNVEGALAALAYLRFESVAVVPNGGTLACEVETWEAGR